MADTKFDLINTRTKNLENDGAISESDNADKVKSYDNDKQPTKVVHPAEAVMVICRRAGGLVKVFQHGYLNNHTLIIINKTSLKHEKAKIKIQKI